MMRIHRFFLSLFLLSCVPKTVAPAVAPTADPAMVQLVAGLEARLNALRTQLKETSTRAGASSEPVSAAAATPVPSASPSELAANTPPRSASAPPVDCATAGPDADGDGLPENCEQMLAEKFAPVVYHSSEERYFPFRVDSYLRQSSLWFYDETCSPLLRSEIRPAPTPEQLVRASWPAVCLSRLPAAANSTRSQAKRSTFYLADPPEDSRAGSRNTADWITYFHAYPNQLNGVTLQYWRFYAWHEGAGSHGGDWVSLYLVLDSTLQPLHLAYRQDQTLKTVPWHALEKESEQRVRVYSEAASHQIFLKAGEVRADGCKGLGGLFICRVQPDKPETHIRQETHTGGRVRWFSGEISQTGALVNLGQRSQPLNGNLWLQYSGLWGTRDKEGDESGDWGPAFQATDMLSNGYLNAWAIGMRQPTRAEAYPLSVSP